MRYCYYDTETCGLCGPAITIQYAFDDGPIQTFEIWRNPIIDTLKLIEEMMQCCTIGFNLVFDHFQLCKLYTMFSLYPDHSKYPEDIIHELAMLEPIARDGPCVKPLSACDIMLHARKGPYQSTMDRHDIIIKRVPTSLAWFLCEELENRVQLPEIYFARKKDKSAQWQVDDIEVEEEIDPDWKNISLRFRPSSALKALATDALKLEKDNVLLFHDIGIHKKYYPEELGYAPFALAIGNKDNWKGSWPDVIKNHINHWAYHQLARKYAQDDVDYTRRLYKYFGSPEPGDDDSILACMVAAVRWHGFKVDLKAIETLKESAIKSKSKTVNGKEFKVPTAPGPVRYYIQEHMDATEKLIVADSTKKVLLQEISKWDKDCPTCQGKGVPCDTCNGKGLVVHTAAIRAQEVLDARLANYEIDFYNKLLLAGRLHADFRIIGALSSRMSGASGLNTQGIKKEGKVRSSFPLAFNGYSLDGGDFSGFEVTLAEAAYNDPNLRKDLLTCENCNVQMSFYKGSHLYRDILSTEVEEKRLETKIDKYLKKNKNTISQDQILKFRNESFENDFICPSCGGHDGKAIHALFGVFVFPECDYWSLKKTKGTSDDKYTRAKSGVFSLIYGGTTFTLQDRLGVPEEVATKAELQFYRQYPGIRKNQLRIINDFSSMKQPGGIGTKVEWHEPKEFISSLFGFRRYFTLENKICKVLYELAQKPPVKWRDIKIKVQRRDRIQTVSGAVQSALFAAAFALQASNTRAAVNHEIQSSGAQITKCVQRKIWDIQPSGIHKFNVLPMNIHDEILTPTLPEYSDKVKAIVNETVESFRERVPLIKLEWNIGLKSWADK